MQKKGSLLFWEKEILNGNCSKVRLLSQLLDFDKFEFTAAVKDSYELDNYALYIQH